MKTILVVEDEPIIATVVAQALESEGYAAQIVVDGEAIATAVALRPALVLLDMNMPEMDGIEVSRRLRADKRTAAIPLVLMSAAGRLRERAQHAPVDALLAKPFDLDDLLTTVEELAGDP